MLTLGENLETFFPQQVLYFQIRDTLYLPPLPWPFTRKKAKTASSKIIRIAMFKDSYSKKNVAITLKVFDPYIR